jgi:hypothetical protein
MRRWGVGAFLIILAGVPAFLALQATTDVNADPKKTKPCGAIECSVNELCCFTGCPPQDTCLPKSTGQCPPPLPCPPPASVQTPASAGQ